MKTMTGVAAVAALLALSACSTGPQVRAVSDSSADFASYKTFGFASPLGTDQSGYQSIVSQHLKAAARRELETRGLRYVEAQPQLIVNFNARLDDKLRVTSTPAPVAPIGFRGGYYGYRTGFYGAWPLYQDQTTVTQYKEGTLNIDVADTARKQLVWEGVVQGSVTRKALANPQAAIETAVAQAFAKFPVAAPGAAK